MMEKLIAQVQEMDHCIQGWKTVLQGRDHYIRQLQRGLQAMEAEMKESGIISAVAGLHTWDRHHTSK